MRRVLRFHLGLLRSPVRVKIWLGALLAVNMLAPLFFLDSLEAKLVLVAFGASMVMMIALTGIAGFTRLLGLGHILWVPLVLWLITRLEQIPAETPIGIWVRALIVLNTVSLVLDAIDVARYVRGERQETVAGLP
jgi:hypothetical protein